MNIQDLKSTISNSAFKKSYSVSNISFKNFFTSIELYTNTDGNDLDSIFKAVPRFQRENDKWSESMQIKFIENVLKGLRSEILLFKVGDNILDSYMILDGLQLLPTVYGKGIDSFEDSGIAHYEGWKDDVIAESFKLAEAYYNHKEKYLKEVL